MLATHTSFQSLHYLCQSSFISLARLLVCITNYTNNQANQIIKRASLLVNDRVLSPHSGYDSPQVSQCRLMKENITTVAYKYTLQRMDHLSETLPEKRSSQGH